MENFFGPQEHITLKEIFRAGPNSNLPVLDICNFVKIKFNVSGFAKDKVMYGIFKCSKASNSTAKLKYVAKFQIHLKFYCCPGYWQV